MAPTYQRLESSGKSGRFSAYLFRKPEARLGSVQRDDQENRSTLLYGGGGLRVRLFLLRAPSLLLFSGQVL